ncbi:MAG: Na/Pi symporter [Planctomycetota bacterium]
MKLGQAAPARDNNALRVVGLVVLLYVFLVAINLLSDAFKTIGKGQAETLLGGMTSPFAGLAVGILATVLVQSSSVTTSMVVSAVAGGALDLDLAVFTIMGCNVGTTITNTLVSLGHARQDAEFRRAFAGATMHDFFNILAIAIFLPLEMMTGFLKAGAGRLAAALGEGGLQFLSFTSPIKTVVKFGSSPFKHLLLDGSLPLTLGVVLVVVIALTGIFVALLRITRIMRALMAARLEQALNAALSRSGLLAILIGIAMTVAVQSSSITTSLMVPLFAAGILELRNGFPVTLGANIGTTVTALIATLGVANNDERGQAALTIALVHLLFNVCGTVLIYPIPAIRDVPVRMAEWLAGLTMHRKAYAILYILVVFVLLPLVGILLTQ